MLTSSLFSCSGRARTSTQSVLAKMSYAPLAQISAAEIRSETPESLLLSIPAPPPRYSPSTRSWRKKLPRELSSAHQPDVLALLLAQRANKLSWRIPHNHHSVALSGVPRPRKNITLHSGTAYFSATQFQTHLIRLSPHHCGINPLEKCRHRVVLRHEQKIHGPIQPRNISFQADPNSQHHFSHSRIPPFPPLRRFEFPCRLQEEGCIISIHEATSCHQTRRNHHGQAHIPESHLHSHRWPSHFAAARLGRRRQ